MHPGLARSIGIPLAILAATALVYWPGLDGGFVFDDFQNLLMNPALASVGDTPSSWVRAMFSSPSSELQRPLSMLSFAANHYFTGFDPRAMKLTNLCVHGINVLLAFALLRRLSEGIGHPGSSTWVAALASAAWALHPINLMVVLYVVQRMESLGQVFVLLGLLLYVVGRQRQLSGRSGLSWLLAGLIACTGLAVMGKESGVVLPAYAFLVEVFVFRFRTADGRTDRRILLLFALTLFLPALAGIGWLLPRALDAGAFASRNFTLGERLLTEGRVVCDYLRWTLLPDLGRLSLYHDDYVVSRSWDSPWTTLPALLLLSALAMMAWKLRLRRPLVGLGLAWFLCAHLLTATFIPLEIAFEHRNYFASLGICLALADLLVLAPRGRSRLLATVVAGAMVAFFAGTTYLRASEWSNPLLFAETEAAKHPASPRATYEAARALVLAGKYDPDSRYTRRAWTAIGHAMQVPDSNALPAQAALMLAARTGRPIPESWWRLLQAKVRDRPLVPENQMALVTLTDCAAKGLCAFERADMVASFQAALEKGDVPPILDTYAEYALSVLHDHPLALALWQEAARREPRSARYRLRLAELEISIGHYPEAREHIDALRGIGRLGQFAAMADQLSMRLARAQAAAQD